MKKSNLLSLLLGVALGALIMFFAKPDSAEDESAEGSGGDRQSPRLSATGKRDADSAAEEIAELKERLAELEAAGGEGGEIASSDPDKKTKSVMKIFGGEGESQLDLAEFEEQMAKSQQERTAKAIDSQLAMLTDKLGLDGEQSAAVRELLEKKAASKKDHVHSIISATLRGEDSGVAISELVGGLARETDGDNELADEDAFDFDSELRALLGEDQQATYDEHLQARKDNFVEASANRQLAQLQTRIPDLSKDQKDRAFQEFGRIAREDADEHGTPGPGSSQFDIARQMRQQEQKRKAMEGILNPEQMETYDQSNTRAISILGGNPGSGVISSSIIIDSVNVSPGTPTPAAPPVPSIPADTGADAGGGGGGGGDE